MIKNIAVIPGDGIGPEIVTEAQKVLDQVATKQGVRFNYEEVLMGGIAIDQTGVPLPNATIDICKRSDAVLLGAVGGPKWDVLPGELRPETGLLGIRKELGLYANLRPAIIFDSLIDASTLKPEVIKGVDVMVVRELTGGIYFGERGRGAQDKGSDLKFAYDTEKYTVFEIERIARVAFEAARTRGKRLCSVDKANVLESSRLWRETVSKLATEYPDVELSHMYVDNAAMQLIRAPRQFDVIVTSNLFGDILSDEASMLTGSIGLLPSASLGQKGRPGLYEPIHGSAPDIAGTDTANPLGTILSTAMMLRYSFGMHEGADLIENAVKEILRKGYRTRDIAYNGEKPVGTKEMGNLVAEFVTGGQI